MHNDDKTCGNCKNWGVRRFSVLVTVPDRGLWVW